MIQTVSTNMQLFKGSYFSVAAAVVQDIYDLIRLSRTAQRSELFHLLQSEA